MKKARASIEPFVLCKSLFLYVGVNSQCCSPLSLVQSMKFCGFASSYFVSKIALDT